MCYCNSVTSETPAETVPAPSSQGYGNGLKCTLVTSSVEVMLKDNFDSLLVKEEKTFN